MAQLANFAMVHTLDQWRRVAHQNTSLEETEDNFGVAQLAWVSESAGDTAESDNPPEFAGMAFDPWCRLYRARPESGQVEKILDSKDAGAEPVPLFEQGIMDAGQFTLAQVEHSGPLQHPLDLVVDDGGRLFVAEEGNNRVVVFDLHEQRFVRFVNFNDAPVRLATDGERVYALFANSGTHQMLARFDFNGAVDEITLPGSVEQPTDLVVGEDIYVLDHGGTDNAAIIPVSEPEDAFAVPFATAMVITTDNVMVVARQAGDDFLRFQLSSAAQTELPHMHARHYDGRGIVLTPEGEVGYWSAKGFMLATMSRVRYKPEGQIISYQLDSDRFQTQWGRLFIDACIPRGTQVTAKCLVADEIPEAAIPVIRSAPDNTIGLTIERPDLSPPMPPQEGIKGLSGEYPFYRRPVGNEVPWQGCAEDDHFRTYETPVFAPPGRFLWVVLTLRGTSRKTPKVKSLRAEYPSHDWLRRLPQVFSQDIAEADFLRRYLAMPEGQMRDLDLRASYRHILLNATATPSELLPWLGSFIGLVVDARWSERAKRQMITEGVWLFRFRGTLPGLKRMIEIYLDSKVTFIEHFKVRGLGGALLGEEDDALAANGVLGAGFRVGGILAEENTISINETSIEDAISLHAHKFSVIIAVALDPEQMDVLHHLLETHRPAHTLYDICTVDSGMRIGHGLHLGLTSIVGQTSGFGELQIGGSILGRSDTLGRAKAGTHIGSSRLGGDSHVG